MASRRTLKMNLFSEVREASLGEASGILDIGSRHVEQSQHYPDVRRHDVFGALPIGNKKR
jgi:hypothetical protein